MLSHFSHVQLFVTLGTVAFQSPPFMRFSRQEYWSGLPCLSPGVLPDPGTNLRLLHLPTLADWFFSTTWKALFVHGQGPNPG